jgi:hypothetical protein
VKHQPKVGANQYKRQQEEKAASRTQQQLELLEQKNTATNEIDQLEKNTKQLRTRTELESQHIREGSKHGSRASNLLQKLEEPGNQFVSSRKKEIIRSFIPQ